MSKRKIDSNWKKLLASGEVKHKKKQVAKPDYEEKTKDGKKTIWFEIDADVLLSTVGERDALDPKAAGDRKIKFLNANMVAIDCEMVGIGFGGTKSVLARATVVSGNGDILLDEFCSSEEKVTDYRTLISGVRYQDMKEAQSFEDLQLKVKNLIKGKTVVGHGLGSDFRALKLKHPKKLVRDTSIYFQNENGGKPSLASLSEIRLGIKIQSGEHSPVQDARAALRIFLGVRKQWEDALKAGKVAKNETRHGSVVDENGLGFDLDAELKHEENSKSFNALSGVKAEQKDCKVEPVEAI